MTPTDRKRSRSIRLLLLGAATLMSGCQHASPYLSESSEAYPSADATPSADHVPEVLSGTFPSEAACRESYGGADCEQIVTDIAGASSSEPAELVNAIGYDDVDTYYVAWNSYRPAPPPRVYWVRRGRNVDRVLADIARGNRNHVWTQPSPPPAGRASTGVVRGGFGSSAWRFGGGSYS